MARYDFATHRLHVPAALAAGQIVPLEAGAMNYLLNVLRMEEGAKLLVFNGRDGEWEALLRKPTRKTAVLALERQTRPQEPAGRIRYAFAPLKSARLDYLVQKAVEMGAARLTPVVTQRCLAVPVLGPEIRLDRFLAGLPADEVLVFCDEDAPVADPLEALRQRHAPAGVTVLVGPEGGFTPEERAQVLAHPGALPVSLGPRILRADTAAVAALALVQAVLGDWTAGAVKEK